MKKKIIIIGVIVLVIGIVIACVLISKNSKGIDDGLTTITIDINPSIEIKVDDELKVIEINSLNQEGKELISDSLKGNTLDNAFIYIVDKAFQYNYIIEEVPTVIIGMENENTEVVGKLRNAFLKKDSAVLIIAPNITKEAEEIAKKNSISPAKAAYLIEVTKNNTKLKIEDIKDRSVAEINEMHTTGNYCDKGWVLNGDVCERKIREEKPTAGIVCPTGYELINDNCFKSDIPQKDTYCTDGKTLKNNLCVGETTTNAKGKCASGIFNESTMRCDVYTFASEIDDKDEHSAVTCPSGTVLADGSNGRACYKKTAATPTYYCEDGATLRGTKCVSFKDSIPEVKLSCDKGYILYEDRICINYDSFKDKINGLFCEEDARLVNQTCVVYESKAAYKN